MSSRHLLRLWLRNEDLAWKTPKESEDNYKKLYYTASVDDQVFTVEPFVRVGANGVKKAAAPTSISH